MASQAKRYVEKAYSVADFVAKLRRLADALEAQQAFEIQVAGEHLVIPTAVDFSIEYEKKVKTSELEFQLRWQ